MKLAPVMKKRLTAAAALTLLCAALTACSAAGLSADTNIPLVQNESTIDLMPVDAMSADGVTQLPSGISASAEQSAAVDAARSIISNGSVSIEVDDARAASQTVSDIAEGLGGYVESQTLSGMALDGVDGASLTIRVPSSEFDAAFEQLGQVGRVLDESRTATDVTAQHVDLQARVASLETSVERLTELMSGAATTGELIEAESALTARQAELDSLQAQLESLEGQVDEATIWVSLGAKSALPGGPSNFWEGLLAGLQSIAVSGAGALVLLGILLPWLVIAGIIALIIVLIVRAARRKSAAKAHAAAAAAAAGANAPAPPPSVPVHEADTPASTESSADSKPADSL